MLWATLFVFTRRSRAGSPARSCGARSAPERCLFVGSEESFERLTDKLDSSDSRAELVGRMSLTTADAELVAAASAQLHRLIDELDVHRVVIEPTRSRRSDTLDFVREAKATGVRVSLLPRILEVVGSSIEVDDVDGLTLLGVRRFGLSRSSLACSSAASTSSAPALGLLVLAPLLVLIAVLIKLDSRGPVFFRQTRVGRDGRALRDLEVPHDGRRTPTRRRRELRARNEAGAGLFKIADDPRVTRVGRVAAPPVARRAATAVQRAARRDEPRRTAAARVDEDEQIIGLGPPPPAAHARDDRPLADPRLLAHPAGRDGQARLPLRRRLVAVERREDPAAHRAVRARAARDVVPAAGWLNAVDHGFAAVLRWLPPLRGKAQLGLAWKDLRERRHPLEGAWNLRLGDGLLVSLPRSSLMTWTVASTGHWDGPVIDFVQRYVLPETLVLDVGASLGLWSLPLGSIARERSSLVWAFEPDPRNVAWLTGNVQRNRG